MRVEPYGVGSVMHVTKRGTRGAKIVIDMNDHWRFVRSLYILNDEYQDRNWVRETMGKPLFERPAHWPERKPLVAVLAWTLMPNHFHLLLYEINEGGMAKFMQRLCGSMSAHFNEKYNETGSLFQGAYKSRTVDTDSYLNYVLSYIVVKNVFELYPKGLAKAVGEFDKAWQWAENFPFSSLTTISKNQFSTIIDHTMLDSFGLVNKNFQHNSKAMLSGHLRLEDKFRDLILEDW